MDESPLDQLMRHASKISDAHAHIRQLSADTAASAEQDRGKRTESQPEGAGHGRA
jgi:hypothetical protein